MTFTDDGLTIANVSVSDISANTLNSNLSNITSIYSSRINSNYVCIPSGGTISLGDHSFSAQELGTLLRYLQQLHPESQV